MNQFNDGFDSIPGNLPQGEVDSLIRKTYSKLTEDIAKTLKNFIIFADEESVIEVPAGHGDRSKIIEVVMSYFADKEEYDKCEKLQHLMDLLNGD